MLGEMLLSNSRVLALDEVSTGLDAAVTLHIFSALRDACRISGMAVITSLLQATPETYALFDDVLLLRHGYTVYHGRRTDIPRWLKETCGVELPPGTDEAGFLVAFLTDPDLAVKELKKQVKRDEEAKEKEKEKRKKKREENGGKGDDDEVSSDENEDPASRSGAFSSISGSPRSVSHVNWHDGPSYSGRDWGTDDTEKTDEPADRSNGKEKRMGEPRTSGATTKVTGGTQDQGKEKKKLGVDTRAPAARDPKLLKSPRELAFGDKKGKQQQQGEWKGTKDKGGMNKDLELQPYRPREEEDRQGFYNIPLTKLDQRSALVTANATMMSPPPRKFGNGQKGSSLKQWPSTAKDSNNKSTSLPSGAKALYERYRDSRWYAQMEEEIELAKERFPAFENKEWSAYSRKQYCEVYPHSTLRHGAYNLARQYKLVSRNKALAPPRLFQCILMGIVLGTLFLNLNSSQYSARFGLLLYFIMFGAFSNLSEVPLADEARNVVSRQIESGFYPATSYAFSVAIMHIPLTLVEAAIFGNFLYWLPAFTPDAGRFFFFFGLFILNSNAFSVFFRSISYLGQN